MGLDSKVMEFLNGATDDKAMKCWPSTAGRHTAYVPEPLDWEDQVSRLRARKAKILAALEVADRLRGELTMIERMLAAVGQGG